MKEFFDFMVKDLSVKKEKFIDLKEELAKNPDLLKGQKTVKPLFQRFPVKKTPEEAVKVTDDSLQQEAIEKQNLSEKVRKIREG